MNRIKLNLRSALAGVGLVALCLLVTSLAAPQEGMAQRMIVENIQDLNSYPNPTNWVVIREGTTFTVPADTILALTALGSSNSALNGATIRIDGAPEVAASGDISTSVGFAGNASSMMLLSPGLAATAGQTVEVTGGFGFGRAWGYLSPLAPL